ncbi:MAG: protein kinase [Deltaproteobacteria bacterium]|nr:protein kinase [Deltaproteobacteria bacterium]
MRYCPRCGTTTPQPNCPNDGTPTVRQVSANRKELGPGDVIGGRYRVLGQLGHGGFGTVFDTVHVTTGHPVAVKVLLPMAGAESAEMSRRFFQEAATTSRLTHPSTVRVFDFGQTDTGELYLAMERLSGETLQALLHRARDRGEALDDKQTVDIGVAVLRSLGEAHALGLVHRDMKPANIFLHEMAGGEAIVKVLDFGIVKTHDTSMTQAGKALGTPTHMSPEQAMGHDVNGRSDLYSLGVVLYECLAGSLPFDGENPLTIVMRHVTEAPEPLWDRTGGRVSPELCAAVDRALVKQPAGRWQSALEMRQALEAAVGTAPQTGMYRIPVPTSHKPPATMAPTPAPTPIRPPTVHKAQPAPLVTPIPTPTPARASAASARPVSAQINLDDSASDAKTVAHSTAQIRAHRDRYLRDSGGIFEVGGAIGAEEESEPDTGGLMPIAPRMDSRMGAVPFNVPVPDFGGASRARPTLAPESAAADFFAHPRLAGLGGLPMPGGLGAGLPFDRMAQMTRPLPMHQQPARRQVETLWLGDDLRHAAYADPQHQVFLVDLGAIGPQPLSVLDLAESTLLGTHGALVEAVVGSPDGRWVVSVCVDGTVRLWDVADGVVAAELSVEATPTCAAMASDGKLLVIGCGDGSVGLYDLPGLHLRRTLRGHREPVTAVACAGSRRLVVTASEDGMVRTWDPVGGGARLTQRAHEGAVASVYVNASGQMVASGGWDGKVHVWYGRTGETALDVLLHDDIVAGVAVDKAGNHVATAGDDRCAKVVHILSGEVRVERRDFRTGVKLVRFADEGQVAAAGAWDGTFRRLNW